MILHVDMDAYYASVEQRDNPQLRGKPVIVGGAASGRGVVCAASYEAREYGVHSAMSSIVAQRLCPNGVFLPARMNHYAAVSRQIRELFLKFTPLVEPLSLDEAFLDVAGSERLFGTAAEIGWQLKHEILEQLELVASVGVAPNKFLAKVASDVEKPDGFVQIDPNKIQEFLDPLPVSRLWGVGKTTNRTFEKMGIHTIEQLRALPVDTLKLRLGQFGLQLWRLARGLDDRLVVADQAAKSISHETTLAVDVDDAEVIEAWLLELADQVGRRLRRQELSAKSIQLKVRYRDFHTITRRQTLANNTCVTQEIYDSAIEMFRELGDGLPVRLLGVGASGLNRDSKRQRMLFEEEDHRRQSQADQAADAIRDKFGGEAVSRASRLLHKTKHRPQPKPTDDV